jgi:tripartite-type tricarboxylate transporter receptor subunit TctC
MAATLIVESAMNRAARLSWLVPAALAFSAIMAHAQNYPVKPIRVVVPFVAGGAVDSMARLVSPKMSDALGQPVLIDNRPGAGGNIGADAVAKAAPDGYTILLNTNGHAISPALYRKLPFDVERDFTPVSQLVATTLVLVSNPKLPAASVKELIALAKSRPGGLNYGSTGVGNPLHLSMELLKLSAAVDIVPVPYKGDAPLNTALMAGEIDVAIVPLSTSLQFIKSGRLRALGVTSAKRSAALPDVPTVAEAAVAGFESSSWLGLLAPGRTPHEVVDLIQRSAAKALEAPDVRERIHALGQEIVASTPEEFEAKVKADLAKFARIVREARIPLQD